MPDARWNDSREYGERGRDDERISPSRQHRRDTPRKSKPEAMTRLGIFHQLRGEFDLVVGHVDWRFDEELSQVD